MFYYNDNIRYPCLNLIADCGIFGGMSRDVSKLIPQTFFVLQVILCLIYYFYFIYMPSTVRKKRLADIYSYSNYVVGGFCVSRQNMTDWPPSWRLKD